MQNVDLVTALGLFTRRGFLEPETCASLRAEIRRAPASPATVRADERSYAVDRSSRSTDWAELGAEATGLVEARLSAVLPEVAAHYDLPLTTIQPLQFLVYRTGDFFERHRDRAEGEEAPAFSRDRRIAAVVFLNDADAGGGAGYRGGALTLYGLFDQPDAADVGLPLEAEEGLLVTFPADVVHEVRPVEAGERYTAVTWFAV